MRISDWSSDVCSSDLVQNMIIRIEVPDQWKLRNQKPWQAFVLRKEPDHDAGKQNGAGHGRRVWHWRGLRDRFGGGGSQCCGTLLQGSGQSGGDRKSTRLNSSHSCASRMPSSA